MSNIAKLAGDVWSGTVPKRRPTAPWADWSIVSEGSHHIHTAQRRVSLTSESLLTQPHCKMSVWTCFIVLAHRPPTTSSPHDTSTTMIKVCTGINSFLNNSYRTFRFGVWRRTRMQRQRRSQRRVLLRFGCKKVMFYGVYLRWLLNSLLASIDLTELDLPSTMKTHFADPADLLNFTLTITPDEGMFPFLRAMLFVKLISFKGMYKGGAFTFSFAINTNYPHDPPKVKCIPKVRVITPWEHAGLYAFSH